MDSRTLPGNKLSPVSGDAAARSDKAAACLSVRLSIRHSASISWCARPRTAPLVNVHLTQAPSMLQCRLKVMCVQHETNGNALYLLDIWVCPAVKHVWRERRLLCDISSCHDDAWIWLITVQVLASPLVYIKRHSLVRQRLALTPANNGSTVYPRELRKPNDDRPFRSNRNPEPRTSFGIEIRHSHGA